MLHFNTPGYIQLAKCPDFRRFRSMPALERSYPKSDAKSLSRRQARGQKLMAACRASLPARLVMDARRELSEVQRRMTPDTPNQDLCSLISASCRLRDQLADLLSLPKRPASAPAGSRGTIPVQAAVLDAILSPVSPPSPSETNPATDPS